MATLQSALFSTDPRLNACLKTNGAHITPGTKGAFVSLIQYAVLVLEGGQIAGSELTLQTYGPTTAAAVLAYKKRRKIINPSYQSSEDNIVGKMTIATLDAEMLLFEKASTAHRLVAGLRRR